MYSQKFTQEYFRSYFTTVYLEILEISKYIDNNPPLIKKRPDY